MIPERFTALTVLSVEPFHLPPSLIKSGAQDKPQKSWSIVGTSLATYPRSANQQKSGEPPSDLLEGRIPPATSHCPNLSEAGNFGLLCLKTFFSSREDLAEE